MGNPGKGLNPPRQIIENFTEAARGGRVAGGERDQRVHRRFLLRFELDMANLPKCLFLLSKSQF